jgi:hypothetical protein
MLCFWTAYGLFNFQNWARRAVMALSLAVLLADAGIWYAARRSSFELPGFLLLFPGAFAALVFWYFSKSTILTLYSGNNALSRFDSGPSMVLK